MKTLLIILTAIFLVSCEKPPVENPITTGTVTFWTTEFDGWKLYVDDKEIGPVSKPYNVKTTDLIPSCDTPGFTKLQLRPGRHEYHIHIYFPNQPWPNSFNGKTYFFDVTLGGCTIVRVTQ